MSCVDLRHAELVRIRVLLDIQNFRDDDFIDIFSLIHDFFHFKAAGKQFFFQFFLRYADIDIVFQPRQRHFHFRLPPIFSRTAAKSACCFQTACEYPERRI